MRYKLSTLWVFVVLNYLYCDVASLMDADLLKQYLTGEVEGMTINELFLLGAGILMEISIAGVIVAPFAPFRLARWYCLIAGVITTIVQLATVVMPPVTAYYLFFSVIEIATTATIAWLALRWKHDDPQPAIQTQA